MLSPYVWCIACLLQCIIAYSSLSDKTLANLPSPGDDFDIKNGRLLAPILQPRVPGTPGSATVRQHFIDFFHDQLPDWLVTFQNSTWVTPVSEGAEVPFVNLIVTRDPPGVAPGDVGRLVLVAHYDSKIEPEGFIGAVDSAAPCAMLLHIARSVDKALTAKWAAGQGELDEGHTGVQIILLDGEEAFKEWTDTDSIYGARALAAEWENTFHPAFSSYTNPLDAIDLFLLLDLLGSAGPTVPSYFKTTHWAYRKMAEIETRLRKLGLFASHKKSASHFLTDKDKHDQDRWLGGYMLDDHIPFMARGVEVLHMIPSPFPQVWHTIEDDGEHLDLDTVNDWTKLVLGFTAEWMELDRYMDTEGGSSRADSVRDELTGPEGR